MHKLFFFVFAVSIVNAQSGPSKEDFDKLDQKVEKILKILEAADSPTAAPSTSLKVDIKNSPVIGDDKAPVTIVEFTDFQCPFCKKFHEETFPTLRDKYISTGKVRFVSRDLPLPATMHPNALQAAEAGRCAGEQNQFWEMRNWMQSNPEKLDLENLITHAVDLKLNLDQFRLCMTTAKYRKAVENDRDFAVKNNVTATPSFVIGKSAPEIDGGLLTGAMPFTVFETKINDLLK